MSKFEANKKYWYGSICDSDFRDELKIMKRTVKSVWVSGGDNGETTRRTIQHDSDGSEYIKPFGTYSMCPILRASRIA